MFSFYSTCIAQFDHHNSRRWPGPTPFISFYMGAERQRLFAHMAHSQCLLRSSSLNVLWLEKCLTLRSISSPYEPVFQLIPDWPYWRNKMLCVYIWAKKADVSKWCFLCYQHYTWNMTVYTTQLYFLACGFLSCLLSSLTLSLSHTHSLLDH